MITACVDLDLYRYEIHAMLKAFYPAEDVKVLFGERKGVSPFLEVCYAADSLTLTFHVGMRGKEDVRSARIPAPEGTNFAEKGPALKAALKHGLYDNLAEITGQRLPWGELIGIRPTKLVSAQLRAGKSPEEAAAMLMEEHRVSRRKAALAAEIAVREEEILSRLDRKNGYSLYLGVPFCPTTCLYCSFPSYAIAGWRTRVGEYLSALEQEMQAMAGLMASQGKHLETIYIGGGTPTTLEPAELERLLSSIERFFPETGQVQEFTVEAGRPDSITPEKLAVLRAHAVSRISVNPQTMNDRTLALIGRRHTVQQVIDAFYMAREAGMNNINMDIILGLPGESDEDVARTLEEIRKLGPDDLTVHTLAVKRGSRMQQWIETLGYDAIHSCVTDETVELAARGAEAMGLVPYYLYRQKNMSGNFENVGYARPARILPDGTRTPARYGIYNMLIIEEVQSIVALGPGSVSKCVRRGEDGNVTITRCDDARDIPTYLSHIDEMIDRKIRLFS